MQTLPLRDLQQRGPKAVPPTHRSLAKSSLRAWQQRAMESGLDMLSDDAIEGEIAAARTDRKRAQRKTSPKA